MTLHLVTFGGGSQRFTWSAARVVREARHSGCFETATALDETHLAELGREFHRRHRDFVRRYQRGFGLWLWKHYLIESLVRDLPRGSTLVYVDAGCELNLRNSAARSRLEQYAEYCENTMRGFPTKHPECLFTKREVFARLGLDHRDDTAQIEATALIIGVGPRSVEIASRWREACALGGHSLLEDDPDDSIPAGPLLAHRHDQSVLSCLLKMEDVEPLEAGTYFGTPLDHLARDWWTQAEGRWESLTVKDRRDWLQEWVQAQRQGIKPLDESRKWRIRGHDFPIWGSRNISALPWHRSSWAGVAARSARTLVQAIRS